MPEERRDSITDALDPSSFAARSRGIEPQTQGELHICPSCSSELVYPVDWAPASRRRWTVLRRCPECEWQGKGVFDQPTVDRFDEALDHVTEQILDDLNMLTRANMEEQVERFVAAIWFEQVLPEDF